MRPTAGTALLCAALVATAPGARADAGRRRCADVNRDGVADIGDVVIVLRTATGLQALQGEDLEAADIAPTELVETWQGARVLRNVGDWTVDVSDAVALLRVAVGLDHLNNCAPLPSVSRAYPTYQGTCTDGGAIASVRGQRLFEDDALPSVWVAGERATALRTERGDVEDILWFTVPRIELPTQWLDVRVLAPAGPVTVSQGLPARRSCRWPRPSGMTPDEAERQDSARVDIGGGGVECASRAWLEGRDSGRTIELARLDPQGSGRLNADVPAFPDADYEMYDLLVENACGIARFESAWHWYRPDTPDVTSVTPDAAPVEGGMEVILRGSNLDTVTELRVGSTAISPRYGAFTIVSPGEIRISSLPASTSSTDTSLVAVTAFNHAYADATPAPFTYVGPGRPRCDSISPASGPRAGGTQVTIRGAAFAGVRQVSFGSSYPWPILRPDAQTLVITTQGSHEPGPVDVHLGVLGGEPATCPAQFTFTP